MIRSMTGYGKGTGTSARRTITVEIKSLNSKQMDIQARMPQTMREFEVDMRNHILESLERGKVELMISENLNAGITSVQINEDTLLSYKNQLKTISTHIGVSEPEDWYSVLMRLPDVLTVETISFNDDDRKALDIALNEALDAIDKFRIAEGRKLYGFFISKIESLYELLSEVEPFESGRVPKIKCRLEEQLQRLDTIEYDKGRLEQELIYYIEKLDITEEKTRLRAHLQYFVETMGDADSFSEKGQGKKLGFIAQEMGREINTLGSKSNEAEMQMIVVRMKDELEQIKEQVLNVL